MASVVDEAGALPGTPRLARPTVVAWSAAGAGLLLVLSGAVELLRGAEGLVDAAPSTWVVAVIGTVIGARVASHAPGNACGWLLLAAGCCSAVVVATAAADDGAGLWLSSWLWWPPYGLLVLALLLFPHGRPSGAVQAGVGLATVLAVGAGALALAVLAVRVPGGIDGLPDPDPLRPRPEVVTVFAAVVVVLLCGVLSVASLVRRVRRADPVSRGPLAWGAAAALLVPVGMVLDLVAGLPATGLAVLLALPVAMGVGVVRYGLFDVDQLVHRALVNALLFVAVLAVWGGTARLVESRAPDVAATVAAAVTVLAMTPLSQAARALVERRLYGLRSQRGELFTGLGRRIGAALTPEEVLGSVVSTVAEGLKVPYVAVRLAGAEQPEAVVGRLRPWATLAVPLSHRGEVLGEIVVQQRSADEPWSRRERVLLADLAAQIGPSAAAVRLTRDLRAARERLVRAREEERRRLRQDLHDGVGPLLTGARMQLKALGRRAEPAPDGAGLAAVEGDLAAATVEVRRIVDGLRPAQLDRGLVAALDGTVRRAGAAGLVTSLDVDPGLDGLPAAVEVAAFRVVDEALTNVLKHAGARSARVTVTVEGRRLVVLVADDGAGPGPARADGVGLTSMAERCVELGGTCDVGPGSPGTLVRAVLPMS